MRNAKLLTIGIPTYNGSKFIKQAIDSIINQFDGKIEKEIEILVSDNASTDLTNQIMKEYQKLYPDFISYYVNEINVGYDKNVDLLFQRAKGRFVKILGDDDYLLPESLKRIYGYLHENTNISILLQNIICLDIKNNELINNNNLVSGLYDGNQFLERSFWNTSPVSSLTFNKDLWKSIDVKKYYGTQWIHIGAMIHILALKPKAYIDSITGIVVRVSNNRWEGHFGNQLKVGLIHLSILSEIKNLNFERKIFNKFCLNRFSNNLNDIKGMCPRKIQEKIEVFVLMVRFFWKYPQFWFIHIPWLFLFIPLKNLLKGFFSFLRYISRQIKHGLFKCF
jgi:glycosyltransferase involved in cell wall biosynthesis